MERHFGIFCVIHISTSDWQLFGLIFLKFNYFFYLKVVSHLELWSQPQSPDHNQCGTTIAEEHPWRKGVLWKGSAWAPGGHDRWLQGFATGDVILILVIDYQQT